MRLDATFLLGVWLEALCYGIYVAAFVVCLHLFRTRAPSVGRALPICLVALNPGCSHLDGGRDQVLAH
ncbi:hypothetical protein FS749_004997 [Ceratobasidium sp. UAMH 11750]|nr:hypothetical protein FS749_004997 [Ceratobasidium sp. UAMH 11750]